jgi:Flp pilus assembly protein TadD
MLGTLLKQTGELDAARQALLEAIRLNPDTPGPFNMLGQILRVKGDDEGSRAMFAEGAKVKARKEAEQKAMFDRSAMDGVGAGPGRRIRR